MSLLKSFLAREPFPDAKSFLAAPPSRRVKVVGQHARYEGANARPCATCQRRCAMFPCSAADLSGAIAHGTRLGPAPVSVI